MRSLLILLAEAFAGTLVVLVCFSVPSLLGLPPRSQVPCFAPALFYLRWRGALPNFSGWQVVRFCLVLGAVIFSCQRWVPGDSGWWLFLSVLLPVRWLVGGSSTKPPAPASTHAT